MRGEGASPAAESVEAPYGWAVVAASMALVAISFGSNYLIVVGLKPISEEFGWPRNTPSLAYSVTLFGTGLGGVAMGWFADRVGIFRPALLGAAMVGSARSRRDRHGMLAFLLAHGVLMGPLGNSTAFTPLLTNATRWLDRRRGIAVSPVASGQSLAGFALTVRELFPESEAGWRIGVVYLGGTIGMAMGGWLGGAIFDLTGASRGLPHRPRLQPCEPRPGRVPGLAARRPHPGRGARPGLEIVPGWTA